MYCEFRFKAGREEVEGAIGFNRERDRETQGKEKRQNRVEDEVARDDVREVMERQRRAVRKWETEGVGEMGSKVANIRGNA
jgi:hypothetical protein